MPMGLFWYSACVPTTFSDTPWVFPARGKTASRAARKRFKMFFISLLLERWFFDKYKHIFGELSFFYLFCEVILPH